MWNKCCSGSGLSHPALWYFISWSVNWHVWSQTQLITKQNNLPRWKDGRSDARGHFVVEARKQLWFITVESENTQILTQQPCLNGNLTNNQKKTLIHNRHKTSAGHKHVALGSSYRQLEIWCLNYSLGDELPCLMVHSDWFKHHESESLRTGNRP